jgi:hypothetical protein
VKIVLYIAVKIITLSGLSFVMSQNLNTEWIGAFCLVQICTHTTMSRRLETYRSLGTAERLRGTSEVEATLEGLWV